MGYAIVGGIGLLLGIALLIWALRERSKRHGAESSLKDAQVKRVEAERIAGVNLAHAKELEAQAQRLNDQIEVQRGRLTECRGRLAEGGSPAAIKDWLDSELKENVL
jgi:hypothetical protein